MGWEFHWVRIDIKDEHESARFLFYSVVKVYGFEM